jgi:hypothetical protein
MDNENMTISNTEKQQRFCKSKVVAGESKISCWLPEDDAQRLKNLMSILDNSVSSKKLGYSVVISRALKELEISLTPAPHRELVRYGLRDMSKLHK